jgi:hypothetical protein
MAAVDMQAARPGDGGGGMVGIGADGSPAMINPAYDLLA